MCINYYLRIYVLLLFVFSISSFSYNKTILREDLKKSYLDWPRINFFGNFYLLTPTNNNVRCNYRNDDFCPICNTKRETYSANDKGDHGYELVSALPMGDGHLSFTDTVTTSTCFDPLQKCSTDDEFVGRAVNGHGRLVDLDTDWQLASEVFALKLDIDGILSAKVERAVLQQFSPRESERSNSDLGRSARWKSKLFDIEWKDSKIKQIFKNSETLSIIFTFDLFRFSTPGGRLSGTIGMTTASDPVNLFGNRILRATDPEQNCDVHFHVNTKHKKILVDVTSIVMSQLGKNFNTSTLKHIDLVLLSSNHYNSDNCKKINCGGKSFYLLTSGGALDEVRKSQKWYEKFGGILEISLKNIDDTLLQSTLNHRIGLINRSSKYEDTFCRKNIYSLCLLFPKHCFTPIPSCKVLAIEETDGINFKPMVRHTNRLSKGDIWEIPVLVTSFGYPLQGVRFDLISLKQSQPEIYCSNKNPCNPYIGTPNNAIQLTKNATTDKNGIALVQVTVVKNPGNARGCNLDGQVYPLQLIMSYQTENGLIRIGEGGIIQRPSTEINRLAKKQCRLNAVFSTYPMAAKVYSSLPLSTMKKKCPTWIDDIRPIFQLYFNLYPVMEKHSMINLRNIDDVRSKLHMINMSMFSLRFEHTNFMPVTRDLSPDKTEIVRKWLNCEINGLHGDRKPTPDERKVNLEMEKICGNNQKIEENLLELQSLVQTAMLIELYTIPPYLTAYFSLKNNYKNKISDMLKSVATEEMLHMTLVANVLNSIGGKPKLTNPFWLPNYPTPFPSNKFYQIRPDLMLKIEKFSKHSTRNLFSEIELPASSEILKVIYDISHIWKKLLTESNEHKSSWKNRNLEVSDQILNLTYEDSEFMEKIFKYASTKLEEPQLADVYTIGAFYTHIMLKTLQLESCLQINHNKTIFTGKKIRQLGPEQWYASKGLSKGNIVPVTGLKTAIGAILEVIYEGEGSMPSASPFISEKDEVNFVENKHSSHIPDEDKSHYVKFLEIANGFELKIVDEKPHDYSRVTCLPQNINTPPNSRHYCFTGEPLNDISEELEVWPIEALPSKENTALDEINPKSKQASKNFNMIYTFLLKCLEKSFNGHPHEMSTCTGKMYELLNAGKIMAKTNLYKYQPRGVTTAPQWLYQYTRYEKEGFYDDYSDPKLSDDPIFC